MLLKRVASLILSGALVVGIMAGCTKIEGNNATTAATQASVGTTAKPSQTEPVTIRYLCSYRPVIDVMTKNGEDLNNNRIAKAHNENSGITVQWEMLPKTDADTKIAMIFAGGDVPDLISLFRDNAFKYAAQGALMPLDDLIKNYGQDYLDITPKDVLDAVKYNGKSIAYAMRGEGATEVTNYGVIVRRDIMDELGLQDPKTIDEFLTLMKTVKDKKNMIPIECSNVLLQPIMGAFGVAGRTVVKDGKLEFAMIQPEFKEYLAFIKNMYDNGLVKDQTQKYVEGRAFSFMSSWVDIALNKAKITEKFPQAKMDFIPYPEGKNGMKGSMQNTIYSLLTSIPAKAKQPEAAARFVNYMGTEKAGIIQDHGIESIDYKVENGNIVQTLEQQQNVTWKICYQTIVREDSFPKRLKLKGFDWEYGRQTEMCKGCILPEATLVSPPIEEFDTKWADLNKHVEEYSTKVVMGAASLDDFDKYVQEFNAKGGKEAIDAINEWYTKK